MSLFTSARLGRILVLLVGASLLSYKLSAPFVGHHEGNSAQYTLFARNFVAYGIGGTKLYCTWGNTASVPAEPVLYLNHPPLIAVWVAAPVAVFGDHEWAARLVPIAATLGSAYLLMIMMGRLHSHGLGVLAGLFYVTLPAIDHFGRMVDHVPLAQWFSLLMLHGYLLWSGVYAAIETRSRTTSERRRGAAYYGLGTVLGIGTAWAVVLMAALIWAANLARAGREPAIRRLILWLTALPAAALLAVSLHILVGTGWKWPMFAALLVSRTAGQPVDWTTWAWKNWSYLQTNASCYAAVAIADYVVLVPAILRLAQPKSAFRNVVRSGLAVMPVLLIALQGLLFIVVFRNQSYIHDYWQYLLMPFVAVAFAAMVLACYTALLRVSPVAAGASAVLVVALMPLFAQARDRLYESVDGHAPAVETFTCLARLIPDHTPAMVSTAYPHVCEELGGYANQRWLPLIEYYARRPLIQTTRLEEIVANAADCRAYILERTDDPLTWELRRELAVRYTHVTVGERFTIFLLDDMLPHSRPK